MTSRRSQPAREHWMRALATGYEDARSKHGDQPLILLSDIDGTILDMRHMIRGVLLSFDREHRTQHFERLRIEDITVHENQVDQLLEMLDVPDTSRKEILDHYLERRWSTPVITEVHQPFQGVLEVIRWFQLQPNTKVGLVTGRPETLRESTLRSLNVLGKLHRVEFSSDLLYMNPIGWEGTADVKVAGLRHFQEIGYFVFGFIDNEPNNLKAVAKEDDNLLLLHANTIFESRPVRMPRGTVRGSEYRVDELIRNEEVLPRGVQMVWHGVNDETNLRQFIASNVHWAEVDVRLEPSRSEVVLRHDSIEQTPLGPNEEILTLADVLDQLKQHGRAVKLDLKGGNDVLESVFEVAADHGFSDEQLWFNAGIQNLRQAGFERIAVKYPDAVVQCPIDFLSPLIVAAPRQAHEVLEIFREWGINRFSVSWQPDDLKGADQREVFDHLDQWGYDINIYKVQDLEAFLHAVLLMPRSVTADYNFPKWRYFGHGSGQDGHQIDYGMIKKPL